MNEKDEIFEVDITTKTRLKTESFRCKSCGAIMNVYQNKGDEIVYPNQCWENQGGCGRNEGFNLVII